MLRFALAGPNRNVYIIRLSSNKIHHIPFMVLHCAYGLGQTRNVPKPFVIFANVQSPITTTRQMRLTGFRTV